MSDFLSRLVDRSTGTATAARPVIPPLFGPAPSAEPGANAPSITPVSTHDDAPASTPATVALTRASSVGPVVPPPAEVAAPARAVDTPAPVEQIEHRDAAPADPAPIRVVVQPSTPWPEGMQPRAVAVEAAPAVTPALREPTPPAIRAAAEPPAMRLPPLAPPQPAPWVDGAARREPTADEGPVVIVNIGRIDVRATTAGVPPALPAPRRPAAVSLEEYLRPRRRDR